VTVSHGREVLVVSVAGGRSRPYTYRGRAYRRIGSTNHELSRDEYNTVLLERLHGEQRWEIEGGVDVHDRRPGYERDRRHRGGGDSSRPSRGSRNARSREVAAGAWIASRRNAAFARRRSCSVVRKRLETDYPQCLLKVARFRGTDRTEFLDNRQFRGHVFDLLRRAERFVLESIPIAGHIEPGRLERVDQPLYPLLAVREALANAFCHREYSWAAGSVSVGIYDDRLEVTSSGSLHFGLTPEALYDPHESLPWNPLIAGVLYRRGIIEQWGRGDAQDVGADGGGWASEAGDRGDCGGCSGSVQAGGATIHRYALGST
jgi:ATP-dependent DNA helicase RecG